jgi:hypothetical protein
MYRRYGIDRQGEQRWGDRGRGVATGRVSGVNVGYGRIRRY